MPGFNRYRRVLAVVASLLVVAMVIFAMRFYRNPQARWNALNGKIEKLTSDGKYEAATPAAQKALALAQTKFGERDVRAATSLENLAEIYSKQGKGVEAEQLAHRALDIAQAGSGSDNPEVARALYTMAEVQVDENQLAKAEPFCREALEIQQRILPPDDPTLGHSLHLMAYIYQMQFKTDKYSEVEADYQQALTIREKAFGPDDLLIAPTAGMLGRFYFTQARWSEAEPLLAREISLDARRLGPDHADVRMSLAMLASAQQDLKEYEKAEESRKRMLEIEKKNKTADGPVQVSSTYGVLSQLEHLQGNDTQAEVYAEQSVEALGSGAADSWREPALIRLAELYRDEGKNAEAEKNYKKLLEFAATHSDLVRERTTLDELIRLLDVEGKAAESEPYHKRRVGIADQMHDYAGGVAARVAYAAFLRRVNRASEADEMEKQANTMSRY